MARNESDRSAYEGSRLPQGMLVLSLLLLALAAGLVLIVRGL